MDDTKLTQRLTYTRRGDYVFSCTGPMVVVGNWHNRMPDPGKEASDFVNDRIKSVTVFHEPGDVVNVAFTDAA